MESITRKDRPGQFWGSWIDASGKRRQRKLTAHTLQQARTLLNAEKARVEKTVTLGYAPPSAESLEAVSKRFLKHQKARLTPAAYKREDGILEAHLRPFFGDKTKLAAIRRADVQKYITHRSGEVSPASIVKELNVLKHLLGLAVEWELIGANPAHGVKSPKVAPGRVRYLQPTRTAGRAQSLPGMAAAYRGPCRCYGDAARRDSRAALAGCGFEGRAHHASANEERRSAHRVPQQTCATGARFRSPRRYQSRPT